MSSTKDNLRMFEKDPKRQSFLRGLFRSQAFIVRCIAVQSAYLSFIKASWRACISIIDVPTMNYLLSKMNISFNDSQEGGEKTRSSKGLRQVRFFSEALSIANI